MFEVSSDLQYNSIGIVIYWLGKHLQMIINASRVNRRVRCAAKPLELHVYSGTDWYSRGNKAQIFLCGKKFVPIMEVNDKRYRYCINLFQYYIPVYALNCIYIHFEASALKSRTSSCFVMIAKLYTWCMIIVHRYQENEDMWAKIKAEILGESDSDEEEDDDEEGDDSDEEEAPAQGQAPSQMTQEVSYCT